MKSSIRVILLEFVVSKYQQSEPKMRPQYLWVREYDSANSGKTGDAFPLMKWANRVWLLNEQGLQERSILDWRRFEVIHFNGRSSFSPPNPIWNRGVHEIGFAAFSPTNDENIFYLENIYGGLFGSGWRMKIAETGILENEMAWIA
ncbi:MAG TPA: hypothetical protein VGB45_05010 [Abditibacterium sp.]|jgi:hypothetical protein